MKKIVSLAICISLMICCLSGCKNDSKSGDINADGMKIFISVSQADDFRGAFAQKAKELAEKSLKKAIKSLDNACVKGLVHKNKVNREKSRLTKKVNTMEVK